jgi:hypothetical protein
MSFSVSDSDRQTTKAIISQYFDDLQRTGPAGMRSQCYSCWDDQCLFVHIKSFKKESVANHHFRSSIFKDYMEKLGSISGTGLTFSRLEQQKSFESIY